MDTLTTLEQQHLAQCEQIVEHGLHTFYAVGSALLTIRENRLYRAHFATFEAYCQERWGMHRRYLNQLIQDTVVIQNLGAIAPTGDENSQTQLPRNEAQARPLTALNNPDDQRRAWAQAVSTAPDGKITGAHVQRVVTALKQQAAPNVRIAPLMTSQSCEWYTPPEILTRASAVLQGIALDPCSNSHDVPNVPARRHLTQADNGLAQIWGGTVYMNPPYGREIDAWVDKLLHEYQAGRVTAAIALIPARTDTAWFRRFRQFPICFVHGRLTFSGADNSATFPSAIVALGVELAAFVQQFSDMGDVYVRVCDAIETRRQV